MSFLYFFILSGRRCTGAFEIYLECFAFGIGVFAYNVFRATDKGIPLNIVGAVVSAINLFVYLPLTLDCQGH